MVLGCAGVIAGLIAVARGARPPVRPILVAVFGVVAVLTVLPPAGSTDSISYAASGRTAVIGHSPYVMTPRQLQQSGDPVGQQIPSREIPSSWMNAVSVYGPVATAAEWSAAELGGTSLARITFWLKLEEAIAFGAVVLALDRLLRRDPEMRLRAHLLWSVNPLLLWEIVAGGHVDGLAAAFGLLGIVALRVRTPAGDSTSRAAGRPGAGSAALAGLLIGVATGLKVEYALLGLAVAWACRRSVRALAGAAAGFAVVIGPAYLAAGTAAVKVLVDRSSGITWDTMYQLFWRPVLGYTRFGVSDVPPHLDRGRVRLVLRLRPVGLAIPLGHGLRAAARTAARQLTGSYPQETLVDNSAGIGPVRTVPSATRCTLLWISLWITQGVGLPHSHNPSYRRSGGSPSGLAVRYSRGHWQSTN
jgi:hypothetical protein